MSEQGNFIITPIRSLAIGIQFFPTLFQEFLGRLGSKARWLGVTVRHAILPTHRSKPLAILGNQLLEPIKAGVVTQ